MNPPDGGPAFPISDMNALHAAGMAAVQGIEDADERDKAYIKAKGELAKGMSLRDWFAGMALQGHLSIQETHAALSQSIFKAENLAVSCYEWADAMLAARERKEVEP